MTQYQNFRIAHQLKRRLRLVVPVLRKDPERAHILAILLYKREGVERINVTAAIGSITIGFDPNVLPAANLLMLLDAVIHNLGQKTHDELPGLKRKNRHPQQALGDLLFGIGGMSCTSCALFLELMLQRHPDIHSVSVNYLSETARVKTYLSQQQLFKLIDDSGYQAFAIDTLGKRKLLLDFEQRHLQTANANLKGLFLFSLPVALLSWYGVRSRPLLWVQAALAAPVVLLGGRPIFKRALVQAKQGSANMDSLIALGVAASYGYSLPALFGPRRHVYFDAATAIIDFVMLGRYLEELAKNKVIKDVRNLVDLQPQQATVLRGNEEIKLNADQIQVGDILLIRPGERIPADGVVVSGLSNVNEAMVTGAAMPCTKEVGHHVYDGSLNGSGVLQVRATSTGKDTMLSGLVHMVDQAQTGKLMLQRTVDKFSAFFVPGVIGLSVVTFGGWWLRGAGAAHALSNAIAVLLISCPCALGLASPAATLVGSGRAARRGIYIRNVEALESAAQIDIVAFDKTGTITEGNATVTELLNISAFDDERLLQLAASAEFNSEHFIGQAIVRHARETGLEVLPSSRFHNAPDQGIRAEVDGHQLLLGNRAWLEKQSIANEALQATAKKLSAQGKTVIFFAIDQQAVGLFALSDPIRNNAEAVIANLQRQDIETLMMSGDNEAAVRFVAERLDIDKMYAEADPRKKLQTIRELQQQGYRVAMVGDGVNDAPALASADLSLVIDRGSDIAIESSDLILVNGDIARVYDAIILSRETLSNIRQNLFWAFAYNAVAIPFAVAGKLTPTMASAAMAFSSVSVIANSLRLNKS